jgi:hypothetical protein
MVDQLHHPKLVGLLAYWTSKRKGTTLPSRGDIDPLEMGEWLGDLVLIDVLPDGDFRYRLYGSNFVVKFGKEMTGHSISELAPAQQAVIREEYDRARRERAPTARLYTADFEVGTLVTRHEGAEHATWERLVLPLASDGETVDMLLIGAYKISG